MGMDHFWLGPKQQLIGCGLERDWVARALSPNDWPAASFKQTARVHRHAGDVLMRKLPLCADEREVARPCFQRASRLSSGIATEIMAMRYQALVLNSVRRLGAFCDFLDEALRSTWRTLCLRARTIMLPGPTYLAP
jgi:hypothetical protein